MKSIVQIRTKDVNLALLTSLNLLTLQTRKSRSMNIQQMIACFSFCLLGWGTLAVTPMFAQTITHVQLFRFDLVASSVSGAGDVNGDGFTDVIVGDPLDDTNGTNSGSVWVFSGADGSLLYSFSGDSVEDRFGESVSDAGDVNGDGFDDFIAGAPFDDNNGSASGNARVFSGVDGSVLYSFNGDSVDAFFGRSVSGAGDVNSDGFADLIVGAPNDDTAQVLSGFNGSVLFSFDGDSAGDLFGGSVSGAGDVNGDGFADLIVGARHDDNNGPNSGSARVFSGSDGSVLYTLDGDSGASVGIFGDVFGSSVSGAGDINGDGFDDLIVGAPNDDNNGTDSGSARVFSGVDGSVLYNFNGDSAGDQLGRSVSGAGDVNNDGFADLVVGASSSAQVFSGAEGGILYNFFGRFGVVVSGAGDVNGDGVADVIYGSVSSFFTGARVFVSQIIILGDCNRDGAVNFLDITPFVGILSSGSFLEEADVNQDGIVNFLDITPFIGILAGN